MEKRIYLDFNASTPLAPEVVEAMRPFLTEHYGNPSSPHWAGAPARAAVERARAQVAALLGCETDEIVFTSGGTESNNHALQGVFFANCDRGEHIVTSAVEHPAIRKPLQFLETLGAKVTVVPVDRRGRVDPNAVRSALTPQTILVTVMHANNEVGTVQPIAEIAAIAHAAPQRRWSRQSSVWGRAPQWSPGLLPTSGHGRRARRMMSGMTVPRFISSFDPRIGRHIGRCCLPPCGPVVTRSSERSRPTGLSGAVHCIACCPVEPATLAAELGPRFRLIEAAREQHVTPEKMVQAFQFSRLVRAG